MKTARRVTVFFFALALGVVGLFVVVAWRDILAGWYLHRLASSERSVREHAALQLGALRSLKAVPEILEAVGAERISAEAVAEALARVGKPCAPVVVEALADSRAPLRGAAVEALRAIQGSE